MEPLIRLGSQLELTEAKEITNGDIVVAANTDNSYIVRRYLRSNTNIILVPEAKGMEPIILKAKESRIVAKVKAVVMNL